MVERPALIRIASGKNRSAQRWAELAHRGVLRKGAPYGYITHVYAVADVMAGAGGDRNHVVACYLHDTVEDTVELPVLPAGTVDEDGHLIPRRITLDDIEAEFGSQVRLFVWSVTKGPEMKGMRLEEQADAVMTKLDQVSDGSGYAIKGCDLLINMGDLVWDAENHGVEHFSEIFGAHRAERKICHYLELAERIIDALAEYPRWASLREALRFRTDELAALCDAYAAL